MLKNIITYVYIIIRLWKIFDFGNPRASDEEEITAAKAVEADLFITKLANGYRTEVEERGNILSVGE
ncbi:hypothetical protein BIV60_27090 [Bacillus sp. MUM 116]|nr:hypothetical protein BIV60_27090 [Bacillus sp. MUM 116]